MNIVTIPRKENREIENRENTAITFRITDTVSNMYGSICMTNHTGKKNAYS